MATPDDFNYSGEELDGMDAAVNYHRWILGYLAPQLGARVVEVGAGIGSFSELLAAQPAVEELLLIEPATELAPRLAANAAALAGANARVHTGTLGSAESAVREFAPDSFVYINVLEHVEHDAEEVALACSLLPPGGTLAMFVPALPFLYSKFDRSIDHHRRYTLGGARQLVRDAGLEIVKARYFDVIGILPWLVRFKLMGSTTLSPGSVKVYDRFVVPVARRIESAVRPPLGKNVLLTARKPR